MGIGKRKMLQQDNIIECRDTQTGEEPNILKLLTSKDLAEITDNFSEENCIGSFQFGHLYRGVFEEQHLTVKIWNSPELDDLILGNHERRLMDELIMLSHERLAHPCIVSLYGYCRDKEHIAVVYNLKSMNSLCNLFLKDDFTWVQRMKAVFAFACLLKFLHDRLGDLDPFVIRNLAAQHVILDEDYNPKLVDFSMMTGGIFPNRHMYTCQPAYGCLSYIEDSIWEKFPGKNVTWTKKSDVYAFGVIILCLLSKRFTTYENWCMGEPSVCTRAHEEYQFGKSLVPESLQADPCFYDVDGIELSKIGVQCTSEERVDRPSMKEVVNSFLELRIFKNHKELVHKKLHPYLYLDMRMNKKPLSDMKYRDTQFDQVISGMHKDISRFDVEDLMIYTENFSEKNFIGRFQFGKIFRGVNRTYEGDQHLVVKIWDNNQNLQHNLLRLGDEMLLLHHEKYICHPGMVRMRGYCPEDENIAIVLFFKPMNSMHNLLIKDDFNWIQRIKAACGVASLLKFLHVVPYRMEPFVVRNLNAAHILLDEEYNPKLVDFGMIVGGIFPSFGSIDRVELANDIRGTWTTNDDVLSFGLMLQCLISKRNEVEPNDGWLSASNDIEKNLVDQSLQKELTYYEEDGQEITRLVLQCVHTDYACRPRMSEVVEVFQKLKVVESHPEVLCVEKMFRDKCNKKKPTTKPSKVNFPIRHHVLRDKALI